MYESTRPLCARQVRRRSRYVTLRHATFRRNLESIRARGLLAALARGKLKAVWLHSSARSAWAACHVVRRHGGRIEDVVILEVRVPRASLRRSARAGLWYTTGDIPPGCIRSLFTFDVFAA
jgi:hypothetical protein